MGDSDTKVRLSIPAKSEHALIARMALSGVGLLAGLDVDMIGDLRTVAGECVDCLINQPMRPSYLELCAEVIEGRLLCSFEARQRECFPVDDCLAASEIEITRGVLETLMPEVDIELDEGGVKRILCSMPI